MNITDHGDNIQVAITDTFEGGAEAAASAFIHALCILEVNGLIPELVAERLVEMADENVTKAFAVINQARAAA